MRGFELGEEKERFFREGLADRPYPVRAVWGERDPALGLDRLEAAKEILGLGRRDPPPRQALSSRRTTRSEVAQAIADLAAPLG